MPRIAESQRSVDDGEYFTEYLASSSRPSCFPRALCSLAMTQSMSLAPCLARSLLLAPLLPLLCLLLFRSPVGATAAFALLACLLGRACAWGFVVAVYSDSTELAAGGLVVARGCGVLPLCGCYASVCEVAAR